MKQKLCPFFKETLNKDFHQKAFSFKFDETTNCQTKKQYDGFVQYWSNSFNKVVMVYCGSLFVDHCPSEKRYFWCSNLLFLNIFEYWPLNWNLSS